MSGAALLLALALGVSAKAAGDCGAPRHLFDSDRLWSELGAAERCAASAGLSDRERAASHRDAGRIRARLGDAEGAEAAFRRALELAPGDADASYRLAETLRARPEDALALAESAARLARTSGLKAAAWLLTGRIRLDLGDRAGAQDAFERALGAGGDELEALRSLAELGRRQARIFAPRASRAAASAPRWRRAAAHRTAARAWLEAGEPGRAARHLGCALELDPDDLEAWRALGALGADAAARARGEACAAADAKARTVEADPEDLDALHDRISAARARDSREEAAALTRRFLAALDRAPAYAWRDALLFAGETLHGIGDRDAALAVVNGYFELFYPPSSLRELALEAAVGPPSRERLEAEVRSVARKRADVESELASARRIVESRQASR